MINEAGQELRRIRITLVVIAILILVTGGSRTVTVDHNLSNGGNPYLVNSNMVQLGDGYFGVLTSDTNNNEQTMKVYLFDKEKNEVIFINEKELNYME